MCVFGKGNQRVATWLGVMLTCETQHEAGDTDNEGPGKAEIMRLNEETTRPLWSPVGWAQAAELGPLSCLLWG